MFLVFCTSLTGQEILSSFDGDVDHHHHLHPHGHDLDTFLVVINMFNISSHLITPVEGGLLPRGLVESAEVNNVEQQHGVSNCQASLCLLLVTSLFDFV